MRIKIGFFFNIERAPKSAEDYRESDIAGTQTERLADYESEDYSVGFRAHPSHGPTNLRPVE